MTSVRRELDETDCGKADSSVVRDRGDNTAKGLADHPPDEAGGWSERTSRSLRVRGGERGRQRRAVRLRPQWVARRERRLRSMRCPPRLVKSSADPSPG